MLTGVADRPGAMRTAVLVSPTRTSSERVRTSVHDRVPRENADEVSVRIRVSSSRDGFRRGYGNEKRRRARPLLRRRPARRAMPLMDTEREALMHACLAARIKARRKRDYARADELRNELRGLGVLVDDKVGYPLPTRHSRHTARSSIWSARIGVIRTRAPKTVAQSPLSGENLHGQAKVIHQ